MIIIREIRDGPKVHIPGLGWDDFLPALTVCLGWVDYVSAKDSQSEREKVLTSASVVSVAAHESASLVGWVQVPPDACW